MSKYSEETLLSKNYNRRGFTRAVAVGAGALLLAGCGEKQLSENRVGRETTELNTVEETDSSSTEQYRMVEIQGVEVDLSRVEMPDFYTNTEVEAHNRPWADPKQDIKLSADGESAIATPEERAESISIDSESLITMTNEELSTTISHRLERIANAGRDPEIYYDYYINHRLGTDGKEVSWGEYIKKDFIAPMIEALFAKNYSTTDFPGYMESERIESIQGIKETLIDYLVEYTHEYEDALRLERRRDSATLFISTSPMGVDNSIIPNERSLYTELKVKRPRLQKDSPKGDKIVLGDMTVNIHQGAIGEFEMGIQQLNLKEQPR